jgi:hypothetical protein
VVYLIFASLFAEGSVVSRNSAAGGFTAISEFHITSSLVLSFFLLFLGASGRLSLTFLSHALTVSILAGVSSFT